jgi:enamine deaminase RidA (YjgF/YER057c/UK114 family)
MRSSELTISAEHPCWHDATRLGNVHSADAWRGLPFSCDVTGPDRRSRCHHSKSDARKAAVRADPPRRFRVCDFVYLTGQVPRQGDQPITTGTIEEQTRVVLKAIEATLAEVGCELPDVVKAMVWLRDHADFPGFDAVFAEYFLTEPPARSAVLNRSLRTRRSTDCCLNSINPGLDPARFACPIEMATQCEMRLSHSVANFFVVRLIRSIRRRAHRGGDRLPREPQRNPPVARNALAPHDSGRVVRAP